jgi:hypothetical protein
MPIIMKNILAHAFARMFNVIFENAVLMTFNFKSKFLIRIRKQRLWLCAFKEIFKQYFFIIKMVNSLNLMRKQEVEKYHAGG